MLRQVLRSKIKNLTVTDKALHYEGSITLDEDLLAKADILEGEKVQVLNVNNGARIDTYTIKGGRSTGKVVLNGPAARTGEVGDRLMVLCYAFADEAEARSISRRSVEVDERNRPVDKQPSPPA